MLDDLDFTLKKFDTLCQSAASSKYTCVTFEEYFKRVGSNNQSFLIMRHDIDRGIACALDTAKVEHKYGIRATYYFRVRKGTYLPCIINEIASYGHEIGYHYETIDKAKGNIELAIQLFGKNLTEFRKRYQVKTVCAHGNPLTKYDNRDIWRRCQFSDFGLLGEPYLSLDYSKFAYFSDSGRTWRNSKVQKMEGKDYVCTAFDWVQPRNSDELIQIIKEGKLPNICILTHPERWSKGAISFTIRYLTDLAFNLGKTAIYVLRKIWK